MRQDVQGSKEQQMNDYVDGRERTSREQIPGGYQTGTANGRTSEGENASDERIRQDVCDRLMQFGPVDCTQVDVSVENGAVMLTGQLGTDDFVERVEDVVRSVAGVRKVENRLRA